MHMADALISPLVGGAMLAATAATATVALKKLQQDQDDRKIPLMGVLGAFVFTAQMINFAIPGTGSSGHLGGGLLLAALLGPHAGFLTMASVLLIQALFFGDGGLLALGCNAMNLGFFASYIALPLIYKPLVRRKPTAGRIAVAAVLASLLSLQLGAFSVVLQTVMSGKTELPFATFLALMQPIHLAIGLVEGLVTASVLVFIRKTRPELLDTIPAQTVQKTNPFVPALVGILLATVLTGGILSWFASSQPDGLEWSIEKASGAETLQADSTFHSFFAALQERTAILPDYDFKSASDSTGESTAATGTIQTGTSASGLLGGALTLLLVVLAGTAAKSLRRQKAD